MHSVKTELVLHFLPRLVPLICLCSSVIVVSCASSSLSYSEAELSKIRSFQEMRSLPFSTKKGKQVAYYLSPRGTPDALPDRIIVVFPGIGSKALDRLDWAVAFSRAGSGVLLIDYPGRGECEGVMRPSHLPRSTNGALAALAGYLNVSPEQFEGRFLVIGHSFGTAAALQFSEKHKVRRIVLLAPFLTIKRALFRRLGPLAWIIPDNLDNRAALRNILSNTSQMQVTIIHGLRDESIPVKWGRELAALNPARIIFVEVPEGTHTSILTENFDYVFSALFQSQKD